LGQSIRPAIHDGEHRAWILLTLRNQMFDHLQKLSLSFYDRNEVGRIMSRVQNDVGSLQELLSNGVLLVFADLITLVGIVVIILSMNVQLALITMTVIHFSPR